MKWKFQQPEIFLMVILLLAVFLRFYRLNEFPPALYLDEAFDAYDALRLIQTGSVPVFFPGDYGREPLMLYLQALSFFLWGAKTWALRVMPAMVGVLTLVAVYRAAAELFGGTQRAKWLGVLAAGMLAVSFWHLDVSRLSFRVIFVPLFGAMAAWAFWRGWCRQSILYYGIAGIFVGSSLYTYPAARSIPVILIGFVVAVGLASRIQSNRFPHGAIRNSLLGIGVMTLTMGILFAPLGLFFSDHPGAFVTRSSDVSIFSTDSEISADLANNLKSVVRMFIDRGDMNARHNLPGRPALDALSAVGFWIGLLIALLRSFSKTPYLFLLIWMGLSLVPTVLTIDAPHFLRSINTLPAILILVAEGLFQIWERLVPRMTPALLVLFATAFSGALTFHDYFDVWGSSHVTFDAFDGSLGSVVDRVMALSETSNVLLPLSVYSSPQMQFALAKKYPHDIPTTSSNTQYPVRLVTGPIQRTNILLGPGGVFLPQPLNDDQIAQLKIQRRGGKPVLGGFGDTGAVELLLDNPSTLLSDLKPDHATDANFGGQVRLFGYSLDPMTVAPGARVRVVLYWQALRDLNSDYFVATNLLDPFGESFARRVSLPVLGDSPTSLWRRGTVIPDAFDILVPTDAHDGKYRLEIKMLDRQVSDLSLPLIGAQDRLLLGSLTVMRNPINPNAILNQLAIRFGEPSFLTLIGYDLEHPGVRRGEPFRVRLYWRAERAMTTDYSIFLHLLNADGKVIAQQDGPPQNGNAPTSWWLSGDMLADAHQLIIPPDLRSGRYTLAVGVYDSLSGSRLPTFDASSVSLGDSWKLLVDIENP